MKIHPKKKLEVKKDVEDDQITRSSFMEND